MVMMAMMVMVVGLTGCSSSKEPAGGSVTDAKPIVLKAVTAWSQDNVFNDTFWMLSDKVKEKSKGKVVIEWKGGPETIPTFELGEAVRSGVVDFAWTSHSYNVSLAPVLEGMKLSKMDPWVEREKGVYEFWQNRVFAPKLNSFYLGKGTPNLKFNLYTLKPITKVEDFKGMAIRVSPAYKSFVTALKAAPVTTDPGEVYTSLERSMVQGYGWPSIGITDFGWEEVTKYVIEPPFHSVNVQGLVNLDKWKGLPQDVQDILVEAMKEVEKESYDHFNNLIAQEREKMKGKGMEVTTLPPEEAEKYLKLAYDSSWDEILANDKQLGEELKKLLEQ